MDYEFWDEAELVGWRHVAGLGQLAIAVNALSAVALGLAHHWTEALILVGFCAYIGFELTRFRRRVREILQP